ncbi:hypothetical protein AXG93_1084s1010 [Marchantia polymorpha subsp. ruderalis]|uniref:Uncharacterized protein n=1 Tax=Marchantia polymorpha subsp. ruderalis TaxID=1480154 RepID=A0A176VHA6_MARPO|nr:hypothetical protein AXG93_1084s1010 [Marchantia polymorpha subsp. ruderalis]
MTTFLVNFYRGMNMLTKSEEKRFPKERKILESDRDKELQEEEARVEETTREVAREPICVEVVTAEEIEEPLEEKAATSGQGLRPLEKEQTSSVKRGRSSEKADVPELKHSEEHAKELTLSQEILEQVEQIEAAVVEFPEIPSPQVNLVKEKELREEEELRSEGLWQGIATMKTKTLELWGRIVAQTEAHNEEMQLAYELMGSLTE